MTFPVQQIRADFPILQRKINGKPLIYFDNAATCHKPQAVLDAINSIYSRDYSNVHRGVHTLSMLATERYENARDKVRSFINAASNKEIIFTSSTTAAINLLAATFGDSVKAGDEIVISAMEHHSNIVPWQILCQKRGAALKVAPIDHNGEIILDQFAAMLGDKTRLVAVAHISNALGTVNPVQEIIALCKARAIPVLLDGAQAVAHTPVDVLALDCDFYAFSAHKLCAPTGCGVLYGKQALLEALPPYQGGGDMIKQVSFAGSEYADLPHKFEAGTPNIAGVVGLGAAIDYINGVGITKIAAYEQHLLQYASDKVSQIKGLRIIGTARHKSSILSFVLNKIHPHDIGTMLDSQGIAIRAGHHCAMPVMDFFQVPATARASFSFYNTTAEIDQFIAALQQLIEVFDV